MKSEEIERIAASNHYVNNLVSLKIMWGLNTKMNVFVAEGKLKQCGNISDLVTLGLCGNEFAYLDGELHNLKFHKRKV